VEVINYLAENIRSNIRRLEGALIRAVSYSSLTGRPLTIEVLEYLLRDTLDQEKHDTLTIEEIQKIVADYFDIRMGDMTSNRRPQSIAFPAPGGHVLLARADRPLPAHHRHRLRRNHATVLHACRQVAGRLKNDATFRQSMLVLQQRLSKRA
jgi:chromosomal replication initiator protein